MLKFPCSSLCILQKMQRGFYFPTKCEGLFSYNRSCESCPVSRAKGGRAHETANDTGQVPSGRPEAVRPVGRADVFAERGPDRWAVRPVGAGCRGGVRRKGPGTVGTGGRGGRCAGVFRLSDRAAVRRLRRFDLLRQHGLLRHKAVPPTGLCATAGGRITVFGTVHLLTGPHGLPMGAVCRLVRHRCGGILRHGRGADGSAAEAAGDPVGRCGCPLCRPDRGLFPRRRGGGVAGALMRRRVASRLCRRTGGRCGTVRRFGAAVAGVTDGGGLRLRRTGRVAAASEAPDHAGGCLLPVRCRGGAGTGCGQAGNDAV